MKKITLCLALALPLFAADCGSLISKYHAPDPASKTMAQIKRWVKNRVDNPSDASSLEECLVAGAADNPNQASYAGK